MAPAALSTARRSKNPSKAWGIYGPLRHYAEVHLLLEPGERSGGMRFGTVCGMDVLDRNWQNLILTHLEERGYPGVLTGSPITDMKITLLIGRAHLKHTEGGDFRQATIAPCATAITGEKRAFRAVVRFPIRGSAVAGRPRHFGHPGLARFEPPQTEGENAVITGFAPVSEMQGYTLEVASYTRGLGDLICMPKGYLPCHNAEEVIEHIGYDAEHDLENTGDSVFCSHGSGFVVPWREGGFHMHLESGWKPEKPGTKSAETEAPVRAAARLPPVFDDEVCAPFLSAPTALSTPRYAAARTPSAPQKAAEKGNGRCRKKVFEPEYLLIDGYNILFAWDDLNKVAEKDIDTARQILMDKICNYQSFSQHVHPRFRCLSRPA